jgi:hypothetical protein
MSRLLEFILGSILITVFTVAFLFFSAVQYIIRAGDAAHCAWYGSARAWLDLNADGQLNADEPPLSDVQIHVQDIQNQFTDISWPVITDKDGDVQLSVSIPGCSDTAFEIYVEIPEGYRATTRPRIEVNPYIWKSLNTQRVYYFGFIPER